MRTGDDPGERITPAAQPSVLRQAGSRKFTSSAQIAARTASSRQMTTSANAAGCCMGPRRCRTGAGGSKKTRRGRSTAVCPAVLGRPQQDLISARFSCLRLTNAPGYPGALSPAAMQSGGVTRLRVRQFAGERLFCTNAQPQAHHTAQRAKTGNGSGRPQARAWLRILQGRLYALICKHCVTDPMKVETGASFSASFSRVASRI
jgi:hypothetical protein